MPVRTGRLFWMHYSLDESKRELRRGHLHILINVLNLIEYILLQVLKSSRNLAVDRVNGTAPELGFRLDLAQRISAIGQRDVLVDVHFLN